MRANFADFASYWPICKNQFHETRSPALHVEVYPCEISRSYHFPKIMQ